PDRAALFLRCPARRTVRRRADTPWRWSHPPRRQLRGRVHAVRDRGPGDAAGPGAIRALHRGIAPRARGDRDDMTYPGEIAAQHPERAAVVMSGTGETITFRELDERSNRAAQLVRTCGLER